jgi:thymidylate synthase
MARTHFAENTLDDVMHSVINEINVRGEGIEPRKGPANEITGVLLEISDPRARLSRTETRGRIFSALGELCWYLAGSNEVGFISYYIHVYEKFAEGGKIFGGYGPRLFSWKSVDQVANVIKILKKRRDSRNAVIQLFDALDIAEEHRDVPCTCTLQFMLRQGKLHLLVNMRSNDAYLGLPHDAFCFTMLQEIVARSVSAELGVYKHAVGSLHLYGDDRGPAERFLKEGYQLTRPVMPPMPVGDPKPAIDLLLRFESAIRNGEVVDETQVGQIDPYWADLIRLLQVYRASCDKDLGRVRAIRERMSCTAYMPYIDRVVRKLKASTPPRPQKE